MTRPASRTPARTAATLTLACSVLLGLLAPAVQAVSVRDIPALPPGRTAPVPAPVTPAPVTPALPTVRPTGPATSLPTTGTPLAQPHRADLSGPINLQAGTDQSWTLALTNTGTQPIEIDHGACDLRFEVLNSAGEIVRPDPRNTICTMQLVITRIAPGETGDVLSIRWNGTDASGQPVPAGQYTIRAAFRGAGLLIRPLDLAVTVN